MKVGDKVEAVILTLDREERKMSLGIKQLATDPWSEIDSKYAVGTTHTAKVRNFTNFGVFVEIEEGVDGLIHISDLSWTKKIKHPSEFAQKGDAIEVTVLEIDKANRRLSLGHKQLQENPWDVFETLFTVGSVQEGTVTEIVDKGFIVSLAHGVEGFAPTKQVAKEDGTAVAVGDKLDFTVIEFVKATKRITLSHNVEAPVREESAPRVRSEKKANTSSSNNGGNSSNNGGPKDETQKAVKRINSSNEKATLGDISGLAELKAQLEGK